MHGGPGACARESVRLGGCVTPEGTEEAGI